jgi:proline iminopeptidase
MTPTPPHRERPVRGGRRLGARLAFAALVLFAIVAGFGAVVGAAAATSLPVLFLATGWIVLAAGVLLATRVLPAAHRRRTGAIALTALTLLGGVALLWPDAGSAAAPPPGTRWISLPTGSRLAYQELTAPGAREPVPVIFLHGGPGVAEMAGDLPYLGRLSAAGWDTYVYDQLGAGGSSRLADPGGYTMTRAVADLEAFRAAIDAPQVDLLGYSWGSTLAAAYLAAHPDRVARVILASPGAMFGDTSNVGDLLGRAGARHTAAVLARALQPRPLLTWTLAQVNPAAAHAYVSDTEMDARLRAIFADLAPGLYCSPPQGTPDGGDVGFYANTTLAHARAAGDPHLVLRGLATPALIIKGSCDYLDWSSAVDYRTTLRNAVFVYLDGAGHRAYAEQPDRFFAVATAFLAGRPLPVRPTTATTAPPDFQGPHS